MESAKASHYQEHLASEIRKSWVPTTTTALFDEFTHGIDGYVKVLDNSITRSWSEELTDSLTHVFDVKRSQIDLKSFKKLVNASLSPGIQGLSRTTDALDEIILNGHLLETDHAAESAMKKVGLGSEYDFEKNRRDFTTCQVCEGKSGKGVYSLRKITARTAKPIDFHFNCYLAQEIREEARNYRNARGAVAKQYKSVRSILKPGFLKKKNGKISNAPLNTYEDYEKWLRELTSAWETEGNVQFKFQNVYVKNFLEFANYIIDKKLRPENSMDYVRTKLARTFDNKSFDQVLTSYRGIEKESKEIAATNKSVNAVQIKTDAPQIVNIKINAYSQLRTVGEKFRDGFHVMLDLTECPDNDRKRVIDFVSGLVFGLQATIERVTPGIFLLSQPGIVVMANSKSKVDSSSSEAEIVKLFA